MRRIGFVLALALISTISAVYAQGDEDTELIFTPPDHPISPENWVQFTDAPGDNYHSRWSPDGKWIAVTRQFGMEDVQIWLLPVDGGEDVQIDIPLTGDLDFDWSPDSTHIAFDAYQEDGPPLEIWTIAITGEDWQRVTNNTYGDAHPTWSPAGDELAFVSGADGIIVTTLDGHKIRTLTRGACFHPVWSPDGQWIVFSQQNSLNDIDLWIIPAEGGEARQLTSGPHGEDRVRWFPNSQWITFQSDREGTMDIWALEIESGEMVQLTDDSFDERYPTWSPDGTQLAFMSNRTGTGQVWMIDFAALME